MSTKHGLDKKKKGLIIESNRGANSRSPKADADQNSTQLGSDFIKV